MTANKHADLMKFAADHFYEAEWQCRLPHQEWPDGWTEFRHSTATWKDHMEYRVRLIQKPLFQSRVRIPEPIREAPGIGVVYYLARMRFATPSAGWYEWKNDSFDRDFLAAGLCYATESDAIARAQAWLQTEVGE